MAPARGGGSGPRPRAPLGARPRRRSESGAVRAAARLVAAVAAACAPAALRHARRWTAWSAWGGAVPALGGSKRLRASVARCAGVITDDAVPEGHRGLHDALYGGDRSEGAPAHEAVSTAALPGRLDGSEMMHAQAWLERIQSEAGDDCELRPVVGLYALYESPDADAPATVGYSRRVQSDVARHALAPGRSGLHVRVKVLDQSRVMWTRARLEAARLAWAAALGPGGAAGAAAPDAAPDAAPEEGFTDAERRAHQERRLKLEMAMGQSVAHDEALEGGPDLEPDARRRNLIRAVEGDWSAVVGDQAALTAPRQVGRPDAAVPAAAAAAGPPATSPFAAGPAAAGAAAGGAAGASGGAPADATAAAAGRVPRELTTANVRAVLEAVRPILVADGGDVEVIGVNPERGAVMLGLVGACQTCPAAPQTMESGIERALRDHFGAGVVREVVRVDAGAADLGPAGVRRRVEAHLEELQEALRAEGGGASVQRCGEDGCTVEVAGPPLLRELVRASLAHRFPELQHDFVFHSTEELAALPVEQ